jgi:hypothetical protein
MSFPIRTDIPLSSWSGGKLTPGTFEDCNVRRHAKAMRAHSAVDLLPDVMIDGEDDDLLSPPETLGEGEIRFGDLGCSGDCGAEVERRRDLCAEALTSSFEADTFFCSGIGALIDSLRALRVELTISVANMDCSFGDSRSPFSYFPSSFTAFARDFTLVFVLFNFVEAVGFELFAGIDPTSDFGAPEFGNRSSVSSATVAGEQVVVEATAARIDSAVVFNEDILEQNTKYCSIKIQTLSKHAVQERSICQLEGSTMCS